MAIRIGVIGVGIIGEPFVRGLVRAQGDDVAIRLSPRNAERSRRLAAEFGNVRVCQTDQEVLDQSDWVVLALLGEVAQGIVRGLAFRPDQRVISLISAATVADIQRWTKVAVVAKMIPLPFVAYCVGPLAVYPLTPEIVQVFGGLGALAAAQDEAGLDTMSVITSTQSAFFATLAEVVKWSSRHGLAPEVAQQFSLDFFAALLFKAGTLPPAELLDHWREMTPGGLNHAAMTQLFADDAIAAWSRAMDAVQARRAETAVPPPPLERTDDEYKTD